jgi:lipopolysaccharide/colanic/teichoic acid biosynthesis glycosyltransferase
MIRINIQNNQSLQVQLNELNHKLKLNPTECEIHITSYKSIKLDFQRRSPFGNLLLPYFFLTRRVLPKISIIKEISFIKKYRIHSFTEILGRMYYAGLEVLEFSEIDNNYQIFCRRINEPNLKKYNNEGILIKIDRIGLKGKQFGLFKLRTMHPYSEFIQSLILEKYGLSSSGKIHNDIRLTRYGKFFRRYYIDELPQLINFMTGDLKLVGIRPVGKTYFENLPKALKVLRSELKPGCIPPYVAEGLKPSAKNATESEMRYAEKYKKNPFITDFTYFWKSVFSILFKSIRSQ